MKFLVLGATGMAGHLISYYLLERNHNVTTYSTSPGAFPNHIIGNALELSSVKEAVEQMQYDVVVNCIGVLNAVCENHTSKAIFLNSYLPHYLAEITSESATRIFHLSTDCVFSGEASPYRESSKYDGQTLYDRTKAIGELKDCKNLTFRNSLIGPDTDSNGVGFFNWFMVQKGQIEGYAKAFWTGVSTLTLAQAIEAAAGNDLTGLYHLVSKPAISKYELLCLFKKHFNKEQTNINPSYDIEKDMTLICNRGDFDFSTPDYTTMLIDLKEWIESHKELYPHYFT